MLRSENPDEVATGDSIAGVNYPDGAANQYQIYHYEQAGGGEAPYAYFHHSSYGYAGYFAKHDLLAATPENLGAVFPHMIGPAAPFQPADDPDPLTPPASGNTFANGWAYANPDTYQIVAAGEDGKFSFVDEQTNTLNVDEDEFSDFISGVDSFGNDVYGRNISYRSQWDNITNFSTGRIETMGTAGGN